MKKTQFVELIRTIKRTIVSFVSITMFVALSVAVFVGISWSAKAILQSTSKALESKKAKDLEILFPYGLDEEDIATLSKLEFVDEIEGSYTGYSFFKYNGDLYQAKLYQVHDIVDMPLSIEGTIPKEFNEIGIDSFFAKTNNITIGDTIKFLSDVNDDGQRTLVKILAFDLDSDDFSNIENKTDNSMAYLKTDTFVVTALMESNDNLNTNPQTYGVALTNQTPIDCFVYLPKSAFDETSFAGYPQIIVRSNSLRKYSTFSNEYRESINTLEREIRESINLLTENKNKDVRKKIDGIINNAQSKLNDINLQIINGEKQITEGRELLANGKIQLEDAKAKLDDGEGQYNSSKAQLDNYYGIYNKYHNKYISLKEMIISKLINEDYINNHKDEIGDIVSTIIEFINKYDDENRLDEVVNILRDILDNLDNAEIVLDKIYGLQSYFDPIERLFQLVENKLNNLNDQLIEGRSELDDYWGQYYSSIQEYENKKALLEDAQRKIAKAKNDYRDGVNRLNQFIDQTSEIKDCGYTIITRFFNAGLNICQTLSDMFAKLRYTMAALFVCVGFFVCYSTIARIVNDEVVNIGTKKALGLLEKEIMTSYLSYTGISILVGCILGVITGYAIVENVLIQSIKGAIVCDLNLYFSFKDVVTICFIEIAILTLVTYFACKSTLKKNAIKLLTKQDDIVGKRRVYEKTKIWKKLPLITRTIINNCFNEKRRVFSTIVGIAGATSLIVTALTLNDNILDSFEIQYSKYYHFDKVISFDESNDEAKQKIEDILIDSNISYAKVMNSRTYVETPDNGYIPAVLYVPENYDEFNKVVTIEPTYNNQNNINEGLWITSAYEEYYKPQNNDSISIRNLTGTRAEIVPSGFYKNYLTNYYLVMDKATYEKAFNENIYSNAFIVSTFNIDFDSLIQNIKEVPGYIGYSDFYKVTKASFDSFKMVSKALVLVYIALSIAMAFLVLLNLLVMFVNEKKRELIVLMINGYYLKDAKRYIYSDTILLTILGIIFGCIIGSIMGNAAVSSFESNVTVFLHRVDIRACAIGSIGSATLAFIICLIALRKISKFKLTDINKQ